MPPDNSKLDVLLLCCQVRTEEEAIEIELNKIENQFRDYNRERDKKGGQDDQK